jgi:hypothetical protein
MKNQNFGDSTKMPENGFPDFCIERPGCTHHRKFAGGIKMAKKSGIT